MKFFTDKKSIKIISVLLIVLIISSFVNPIVTYAEDADANADETFGGKLFKPIAKLICGICDGIIMGLQKIFLGYGEIEVEKVETETIESIAMSKILYSPGRIFSNTVPALNANFINPPNEKYQVKIEKKSELIKIGESHQYSYILPGVENEEIKQMASESLEKIKAKEYGFSSSTATRIDNAERKNKLLLNLGGMLAGASVYTWEYDKDGDGTKEVYYWISESTSSTSVPQSGIGGVTTYVYTNTLYKENFSTEKGNEIEYSAVILQNIIAKWYNALRLIAMVGLISVLVYIGIRIIISSTGQEKAKYKKMIVDWLAAICIVFVLHYIMAFTTTIVNELIDIFPHIQGEEGEDILMNNIRDKIKQSGGTFWNVFGETIIYVALVTLTCIFTVHYLKRLVYLAFLTMIAPLIALTYPLDKIKDRTSTSIYNMDKRICIQFINTSSSYINIHYICNISNGACRNKSIICCCVYRFYNTCRKIY